MSDVPIQQRTRTGGGRAFHSKLEPLVGFIREQRQRRKTWREIADSLRSEKECVVTLQGVHQFYRRFVKRQARPHWEHPSAGGQLADCAKKTPQASTPIERPFRQPPPDSIKLNDPTKV